VHGIWLVVENMTSHISCTRSVLGSLLVLKVMIGRVLLSRPFRMFWPAIPSVCCDVSYATSRAPVRAFFLGSQDI
jgi:hypothetical protein